MLFLLSISMVIAGCVEARLTLSDQSRLPKWVILAEGESRNDFSVKMEWHSTLTGGKIIFKIFEKNSFLSLREYEIATDTENNIQSLHFPSPNRDTPKGFPKYIMISINGIKDIVEQRKMEPIFYMTDDPAVWREFGVETPNK